MALAFVRKVSTGLGLAFLSLAVTTACETVDSEPPSPTGEDLWCSQAHRELARWGQETVPECKEGLSLLQEVTSLGDGRLLFRKRFLLRDEVWTVGPDGDFPGQPMPAFPIIAEAGIASRDAGFVLIPADAASGQPARMLVYDPREEEFRLAEIVRPEGTAHLDGRHTIIRGVSVQRWPTDRSLWKGQVVEPWDRQFLSLDRDHLLDWDPGNGSFRVWRLATDATSAVSIVGLTKLAGDARETFRRGHRLVVLAPGRLLEWSPRSCASASIPCLGADYRIWSYRLDDDQTARDPFDAEPANAGAWSEIGNQHEIVMSDPQHLVVWSAATGTLRSYAVDPNSASDPLARPFLAERTDPRLQAPVWQPPTASPPIKRLVIVLQDGRSFDAYFGRYCQGAPLPGHAVQPCTAGPHCCDRMPEEIAPSLACTVLDPATDAHRPTSTPDCMREKLRNRLENFGSASCTDPRDFACSGEGAAAGDIGIYHALAGQGALADRYFQTYAYADMEAAPEPFLQNLLYLSIARFAPTFLPTLTTELLTKELVRNHVSWAIYAGKGLRTDLERFGVPVYFDPTWTPFRSLEPEPNGLPGELDYDLARGGLPVVSIVIPDSTDADRSEAPGKPFGKGITFVRDLVTAINLSPHREETLFLVTHLTAGGFFDHVPPPEPPLLSIDATNGIQSTAGSVYYGPRVPFLALGHFARQNHVSHTPLELSAVTRFVEWNWLFGQHLRAFDTADDFRVFRDRAVSNLGSLLDPALAQVPE
jgi:hypothetical protein